MVRLLRVTAALDYWETMDSATKIATSFSFLIPLWLISLTTTMRIPTLSFVGPIRHFIASDEPPYVVGWYTDDLPWMRHVNYAYRPSPKLSTNCKESGIPILVIWILRTTLIQPMIIKLLRKKGTASYFPDLLPAKSFLEVGRPLLIKIIIWISPLLAPLVGIELIRQ